ncbi:YibE/F family protein [Periweissella cryptocerci]|uniref:YibE/F family protein n=1 Tax=Periweissella cryptocerci TaxID=2506420 RepID=A0A4P6YSF5_9LACO|nr:YibE/F family protein [Periweissella cryptocerci]QBO35570.1 YibE/F family protein [Periweissella cryptocerci]
MSSLTGLFLVFAVLMLIVGGKQGAQALFGLLFNFFLLFLAITLIAWGFSPLVIVVVVGIVMLAVTIFLSDDNDQVTRVAFLASVLVMLVLMGLIVPVEHWAHVQGFAMEDSEELEGLSLTIGLNFLQIGIMAAILSTLGAIAEAAMAIAAGMQEVLQDNPAIKTKQLFGHGMNIGRQIIATAINTLFFGFIGSFLALSIWFVKLNYGWGAVINSKIFGAELLMLLFSMIAVILTVPGTAWLMQRDVGKQRVNEQMKKQKL